MAAYLGHQILSKVNTLSRTVEYGGRVEMLKYHHETPATVEYIWRQLVSGDRVESGTRWSPLGVWAHQVLN